MVYKPTYMKSRDMPNIYFNYKGINPVLMNTSRTKSTVISTNVCEFHQCSPNT